MRARYSVSATLSSPQGGGLSIGRAQQNTLSVVLLPFFKGDPGDAANIQALEASVSTVNSDLTSLSTSASTAVSSLSTGLITTNSAVTSLSTSASTAVSSLSTGLSTTNSTVTSLSTSASTAVSSLSTGLSTTNSTVASLSTAVAGYVSFKSEQSLDDDQIDQALANLGLTINLHSYYINL